jgi:methylenetetrahydrofolate reductase (NADPH)
MTAPALSFEFFPPKNDVQKRRFWRSYGALEALQPSQVSVTWGAMGAECGPSLELIESLCAETAIPVVAHLTCSGMTYERGNATLDRLKALGVSRILALRGDDQPAGEAADKSADKSGGPCMKHATDLVELITNRGDFEVSVAAYPETHPEALSATDDIQWLARKAELGADSAITQFFFDVDQFLRWRDRVASQGINITIVPGVLPVGDIDKVVRFAAACGAAVPDELVERFTQLAQPVDRARLAVDVAAELCQRLHAEGIEQFHVYTLNRSALSVGLAQALGVSPQLDHLAA